jgi:VWFA-related protein
MLAIRNRATKGRRRPGRTGPGGTWWRCAWPRALGGLSVLATLCVLAAASHRRGLLAAPAQPEQPVLRVSTRLVQVNVVVETRDGRPVTGLSAEDFALWDRGRAQKISFFSVQSSQPLPKALPPLPAGTFTNRLERQGGAPASVTVILLDGLNTHFEDQAYAKAQIVRFLKQIQPQDHVALYTLGPNLRVLHDFTTDSESLVATLKGYAGKESHEVEASEPAPEPVSLTVITPNAGNAPTQGSSSLTPITVGLEDYLRQTQQRSADWYSMDRTLRTLDALKTIARRLSHLPGRKNLVWVASSFPFTIGSGTANAENVVRGQRSFGPEIERAEQLLNDANLAVYPVDARGLVGNFGVNPNLSASRSVSARLPSDNPTIEGLGQLTPTVDTMQELADETGGRAFYGTNDIMGSIRRALDDSQLTYTLGYYPAGTKWDGKFHELKVRVRRSGVKVLCRRGYFAVSETPLGGKEQQKAMLEAAAEPLEATAIGLTVEESPPSQQNDVLPLTVGIDARSIALVEQQGRWTGSLDLLFAQMSATGQLLNGLSQPIHLRLTDDEYHLILEKGLSISGRIQLLSGVDKLKVIAFDQSSDAVGSVTVLLDRPRVTAGADKR